MLKQLQSNCCCWPARTTRVIALRLAFLTPEIREALRLTVILSTALTLYVFFTACECSLPILLQPK